MKLLAGIFLLATVAVAQKPVPSITGTWEGSATVRGQQVPLRLEISGHPGNLKASLLNGADKAAASSASFTNGHLLLGFNYFARTLDATLANGQLTGTFGSPSTQTTNEHTLARTPFTLTLTNVEQTASAANAPNINGDWEIAVKSSKDESAWQLVVEQPTGKPSPIRAVIQRIDGDTGSLYGFWNGQEYIVSHFTAAGPALYSLAPQSNGTLLVSNLLSPDAQKAQQRDLVARRPIEARSDNLPAPTEPTQQTRIKDPSVPFTFSFPNLEGKLVSSTDPQFAGKVVIVAVGGSWCPNCHDEAPFLESLYKQFHGRGLEIVNLSFEEADQLKDPTRLRAFIARYGLNYTVLLAGETDQLSEKIPQAVHLDCWPTSFFLGRDGRVKQVHAGFAGPANPVAHAELEREVTETITQLLAEPAPTQSASR
jgi:peroxiredoxin